MIDCTQFFIDGQWRTAQAIGQFVAFNPATEQAIAKVALGAAADIDLAVQAARRAFPRFSQSSRPERLDLLAALLDAYTRRSADLAQAISQEMGAPLGFAEQVQVGLGAAHIATMLSTLQHFDFEQRHGTTRVVLEPIGVTGLITPWNWPMNQIVCKVAPALAAGCTMVLKPSELAPLSATIFAEIVAAAGVPNGVFNLVHGDGNTGQAIAAHHDIDMVSFTGSTRAGIAVAKTAADTIKRVTQELGGKSANLVLSDAPLEKAITEAVHFCFSNAGQSCNAPTRLLVPEASYEQVVALAKRAASTVIVGSPLDAATTMGPLSNRNQYDKVQHYIHTGLRAGAELLAGGPGRPAHLTQGYYVQPTIFGRVTPDMTIAREEIFGPVLSILTYRDDAHAIQIANDSVYGLAAYVQSADPQRARAIARQLRVGTVYINNPPWNPGVPFGGYKQSGNGREYAQFGLSEFLEVKGIVAND